MFVFLNGQLVPEEQAAVSVMDRSFLYGDGLFETIPVYGGRPFRWAQHLERMSRGAEFLKIAQPYSPKELRRFAADLIERSGTPDCLVRLTLSRGSGARGYSLPDAQKPVVAMTLHEAPAFDRQNPPHWGMITSTHRLPVTDPMASFKTNNKLLQILARMEADAAGVDEALMLNTNGEVAEASGANVLWVYRDAIYTAPSGRGVLPGITRAVVLELCQVLGIRTNKKVIKPESLKKADGIFLTLSSYGIVPVSSLDGEPIGESSITDQLRQAYWDAVAGMTPKPEESRDPAASAPQPPGAADNPTAPEPLPE
jgi:branched-chain amino acid aminotransferase